MVIALTRTCWSMRIARNHACTSRHTRLSVRSPRGEEAWAIPWPCCYEFLGSRNEPPIQLSLIQPKGDAP